MRKTRKFLSAVMAIMLIFAIVPTGVIASVKGFEKTFVTPTTTSETNIAVWNNYLFVASTKGIDIIDIRTDECVATWQTAAIQSTVSKTAKSFVPAQIDVNDDYIAITSKTADSRAYIAVFENEGVCSSTLPPLISTLGYFNTPITYLFEDRIAVFDLTADNTVNNSYLTIDEGKLLFWNINLAEAENFALNSSKLTQVGLKSMLQKGYSAYADLGSYDVLWKQIDVANGKAYAVTYNNTSTSPYKAITVHSVDMETMNSNKYICEDGHITGVMAEVSGTVSTSDLGEARIFLSGDEAKSMSVTEIGLAQFYLENIDEETAYFYFAQTGFNKISDIATSAEIQTEEKKLCVEIAGEKYELSYFQNDNSYERGTVSAKDGYIYIASNITDSNANRLWVVREADGETILNEALFDFGNSNNQNKRNGWQTSVISGDRLIGFVSNVNYRVASIDISDPESITVNAADTIYLENKPVMFSGNEYASAKVSSDRIYYPLADGSGAGVLQTDDEKFSAKVKYKEDSYPVVIYGECSFEDSVKVIIDGDEYSVPTGMGIYTCPIYSIEAGEHTAEVVAGDYRSLVEFKVNVPKKIIIEDVDVQSEITAKVTNNTQTVVLNVVVASYDSNGKMKSSIKKKFIAPSGKTYTFRSVAPQKADGGYLKMFILNGEEPLCEPVIIDNSGISQERSGVIVGYNPKTELKVSSNLADKIAEISGKSIAGNMVMLKITAGDKTVCYEQLNCDQNAKFSFKYDFSSDNYQGVYTVTATASNASGVDAEFASVSEAVINDVFETVSGMNARELLSYFKENKEQALIIGINMENEDFNALNQARQEAVMNEVAEKINDGYKTGISKTFNEATEKYAEEQQSDNMVLELQKATKNTIGGLLTLNHTAYGISDELWNEYDNLNNKAAAHSKLISLIKYDFEELSQLSGYLKKAISAAKNPEPATETGNLGHTGNAATDGGNKLAASENNTNTAKPPILPTELFLDIADVAWARESINALKTAGVIDGIGNQLFMPNELVTREQFIKMLVLGFGLTQKQNDNAPLDLSDVNADAWYYEYIKIAYDAKITTGNDKGGFGVGEVLTRADAAVFAKRAAESLGKELPTKNAAVEFVDADETAEYAKEAISALQIAGILNGNSDGAFSPNEGCTRAMAAKIVYELLKAVK